MASTASPPAQGADPQQQPADSETVSQCLTFLSRKDDTSRFVGLAMLSSFLTHIIDRAVLVRCWEALDKRFLDRLLRAGNKKSKEEAKDMVELAVNVIHAFATLLPDAAEDEALVARAPGLVRVLPECETITRATILQTLLVFSTGRKGAEAVLGVADLKPVVEVAGEQETAVQALLYAFVNAGPAAVQERLKSFLPELCGGLAGMEKATRVLVLGFLSELLTRIPPEHLPSSTTWVESLYTTIATILTSHHASTTRYTSITLISSLLHRYPPSILFNLSPPTATSKPFLYHLLQLALIDLRASFPSLLPSLHTPQYATLAHRISASYDLTAAFLGHLITDSPPPSLTPDLLLKLRTDLTETFGLTLEFLRDRWDGVFGGAPGFEPGFEDAKTPKALIWESGLTGGLLKDPIVVSALRAVSLWLREEESLRGEAAGMVDFFLGMWVRGMEEGVDVRVWVVGALEGVVEEGVGREAFLKCGGWGVVCGDLVEGVKVGGELVVAEARLLVEVVVMEGRAEEGWCRDAVGVVGKGKTREVEVEVLRLTSACLVNVGRGNRKRLQKEVEKVREAAGRLAMELDGKGEDDLMGLVVEVLEELEGL